MFATVSMCVHQKKGRELGLSTSLSETQSESLTFAELQLLSFAKTCLKEFYVDFFSSQYALYGTVHTSLIHYNEVLSFSLS